MHNDVPPPMEPPSYRERFRERVQSLVSRVHKTTNNIPISVLVLYFINSWNMSFPMTANTGWLLELVKMPQDTMSSYYAFIFIPWCLKPLYAFISDQFSFRGMHRRPWLVVNSIGAAVVMVLMATKVRSVTAAFATGFILNIFTTFTELMASAALIDVAHRDMRNAGAIQGVATTARFAGTLAATLAGLGLYPCGENKQVWSPERVLLVTAATTAATALLCPFIPEGNPSPQPSAPSDQEEAKTDDCKFSLLEQERTNDSISALRIAGMMMSLQVVLVWIALKYKVQHQLWWAFLALFTAIAVVSASHLFASKRAVISVIKEHRTAVGAAVFLLISNATPSAAPQFSSFEYLLFMYTKPCYTVYLSLIGSASGLAASLCYGIVANRGNVRWIIPATATVSSLVGLSRLYLIEAPLPHPPSSVQHPLTPSATFEMLGTSHDNGCISFFGMCWEPFAVAAVTSFFTSFFSQLSFVPREVLATECSPLNHRFLSYAVYLSFISAGGSAREWISAPIVKHFGITSTDFSGLKWMIIISAACNVAVSCAAPVLVGNLITDERSRDEETNSEVNTGRGEEEGDPLLH
eukprot:Sspe_Gene.57264::Locus_31437_Transcript_1_1_Confidence_1.000_Length_2159::g.57264::m.57264